ncbi:hypothetical protein [Leuconostoc citreum]|uniref:hypothetical protein n=1 Tax=Leuconostoc citreum TaxID=33964 RepID=UPI0032DE7A92
MNKIKVYFERQRPSKTELVLYLMTPDYQGKVVGEHLRYNRLSTAELKTLKKYNKIDLLATLNLLIKLWFSDIVGMILLGIFGMAIQAFSNTIMIVLMCLLMFLVVIALTIIILSAVMAFRGLSVFKSERRI